MREWSTETDNLEFHIPAIPYGNRNVMVKNSQEHSSPGSLAPLLPTLDLPESGNYSKTGRKARLQDLCTSGTTLGNAPDALNAPVQCKSTRESFGKPAKKYSDQLYL